MANELLTVRQFRAYVIRLARKHGLHKMGDGIRVAGVEVRWRKKKNSSSKCATPK